MRVYGLRRSLVAQLETERVQSLVRWVLAPWPALEEWLEVRAYLYKRRQLEGSWASVPAVPCAPQAGPRPARPQASPGPHQVLFDISEVLGPQHGAGIARAVRHVFEEMCKSPPLGFRVTAVRAEAGGRIVYADYPAGGALHESPEPKYRGPVRAVADDVYVTLGFKSPPSAAITTLQGKGVRIVFTVHDLIPLRYALHPLLREDFRQWLERSLRMADLVLCVSGTTANAVLEWLDRNPVRRAAPLPLACYRPGADSVEIAPTVQMGAEEQRVLDAANRHDTLLMVGTVFEHKGYRQALDAMEELWSTGVNLHLVVVGKEGWLQAQLARRLRTHPELDKQLFWITTATDDLLDNLYCSSRGLLAASFDEGFCLPLVEAARHDLCIVARDIPIFREVAGEHAFYFRADTGHEMAAALREWLRLHDSGQAPRSGAIGQSTWRDAAREIGDCLVGERHVAVWRPLAVQGE